MNGPAEHASTPAAPADLEILVDADACPVKPEIYRVAQRYGVRVTLVGNSAMRIPSGDWLRLVVVDGGFDAADDWIAERAGADSIVVTGDIPLAGRCLERGARVVDHRGGAFTEDSIGGALADRDLLAELRGAGLITGGPSGFTARDRSQFLQRLDETVQALRRRTTR